MHHAIAFAVSLWFIPLAELYVHVYMVSHARRCYSSVYCFTKPCDERGSDACTNAVVCYLCSLPGPKSAGGLYNWFSWYSLNLQPAELYLMHARSDTKGIKTLYKRVIPHWHGIWRRASGEGRLEKGRLENWLALPFNDWQCMLPRYGL